MCYCTVFAAEEKCTKQTLNILTIQTEKSPFPCEVDFFFLTNIQNEYYQAFLLSYKPCFFQFDIKWMSVQRNKKRNK